MRRAARIDRNHQEIVQAFRAEGALVLSLAAVGKGVPDLLVEYRGRLILIEVKAEKGTLTPDQVSFHSLWPVLVVRSPEEARAAIRAGQPEARENA